MSQRIVCEYLYTEFNARGSDEYVDWWAENLEEVLAQGWQVVDAVRKSRADGMWSVCLARTD
jgi:hypothetical protein